MLNYLTQDVNLIQINELEKITRSVLERKIDYKQFYKILRQPLSRGGASLPPSAAWNMAKKVNSILRQSENVSRYRRRLNRGTFMQRERKLLNQLVACIIKEGDLRLDFLQKTNLKEVIRQRVSGLLRLENFEELLRKKADDGGVGLDKRDRDAVIAYFEKILTQGIDTANKS